MMLVCELVMHKWRQALASRPALDDPSCQSNFCGDCALTMREQGTNEKNERGGGQVVKLSSFFLACEIFGLNITIVVSVSLCKCHGPL
jgi:hypothetical protein